MSDATLTNPNPSDAADRTRTCPTDPSATVTESPDTRTPLPPAFADAPPGYVIEGELGRGGMGVVYRARQHGLNRPVALKMVLAAGADDPKALIRFLAEAEAVAAVRHPAVVEVYAYGDHAGRPFLAMEFCPGGSLSDRLKAGDRFDPRAVANLLAAVAEGVGAAHALGIVHRDLKPHNVLLDAAGDPKVTDFGLAKRGTGADLTYTGAVMGTPAYMSPEQAGGGAKFVGPQSDVWSLGVILYELLSGDRPFAGEDSWSLLRAVVEATPAPVRTRSPGVPRDVALICEKCLSKDPADRYADANELAADLRRFAAGEPVGLRSATWAERGYKWAKRKPTVAAAWAFGLLALGLGGGVAGVGWLWQQTEDARLQLAVEKRQTEEARDGEHAARGQAEAARREAEAARDHAAAEQQVAEAARDEAAVGRKRAEEAAAREREAKTEEAAARKAAEDATRRERAALDQLTAVRYARTVDLAHREYRANDLPRANRLLAECPPGRRGWEWDYVHRLCNAEHRKLDAKAGHAYSVGYSPDGQRLVTAHGDRTARVWDAAAGTPLAVLDGHRDEVLEAAFTPDGRSVVTASADGTVKIRDADTGKETATLTDPTPGDRPARTDLYSVAVSPDGMVIAAGGREGKLRIWSEGGAKFSSVRDGEVGEIQAVRYSPDGKWVAVGGRSGGVKAWARKVSQPPVDLTAGTDPVAALAFAADGRLAVGSADGLVRVWDVANARLALAVQAHPAGVTGVAFAPDGKRLVTGGRDRSVGVWDAATGRPLAAFKGHADSVWGVAVDPAGAKVAAAGLDGTTRVWSLSGGQDWQSIPVDPSGVSAFAVAPDGKWLVAGGKTGKVAVVDLLTGKVGRPGDEPRSGFERWRGQFLGPREVYVQSPPPLGRDELQPGGSRPPAGREKTQPSSTPPPPTSVAPPPERTDETTRGEPPSERPPLGRRQSQEPPSGGFGGRPPAGREGQSDPLDSPMRAGGGRPLGREAAPISRTQTPSGGAFGPGSMFRNRQQSREERGGAALGGNPAPQNPPPTGSRPPSGRGEMPMPSAKPSEQDAETANILAVDLLRMGESDTWRVNTVETHPKGASRRVFVSSGGPILEEVYARSSPPSGRTPDPAGSVAVLSGAIRAIGRPDGTVVVSGLRGQPWEFAVSRTTGIGALSFDAGAERLYVGCSDAILRGVRGTVDPDTKVMEAAVWDMAAQTKRADLRGHTAGILSACFSPDGKLVATGSKDNTARVWDAATGRELQLLAGHLFWVRAVAFSPDGKRLATGGMDGAVKVWDPATGSELLTLPAPADGVTQVAFTPDGAKLIAAGLDGTIRVFDATPAGERREVAPPGVSK